MTSFWKGDFCTSVSSVVRLRLNASRHVGLNKLSAAEKVIAAKSPFLFGYACQWFP